MQRHAGIAGEAGDAATITAPLSATMPAIIIAATTLPVIRATAATGTAAAHGLAAIRTRIMTRA